MSVGVLNVRRSGSIVVIDLDSQPSREVRIYRDGGCIVVEEVVTDELWNPEGEPVYRAHIPIEMIKEVI